MEALQPSVTEQNPNIVALESPERNLLDKNRRLQHQLDVVMVKKECDEVQDMGSRKAVTDARVDLAQIKEALHALESRASMNRLGPQCVAPKKVLTACKANW